MIPSRLTASRPSSAGAAPASTVAASATTAAARPPPLSLPLPNHSPPAPAASALHPPHLRSHPQRPTPSSTRPPTPRASPEAESILPPPLLLNELGAGDGESILVIVVEEGDDGVEGGRGRAEGRARRNGRVYGGSQGGDILVWDLENLSLRARLCGHEGAVLALQVVQERDWLISSSGDGTIRVWHTPTLIPLYVIHPPHDNVGDIFSLAWIDSSMLEGVDVSIRTDTHRTSVRGRLYAGCQDTSIQWIDLPPAFHLEAHAHPFGVLSPHLSSSHPYPATSSSPPIHRAHNKFFDSLTLADRPSPSAKGRLGRNSASTTSLVTLGHESEGEGGGMSSGVSVGAERVVELQFEDDHIAHYAHYGYVYCLALGKSNDKTVLVSGSGDEQIKLWRMEHAELKHLATLSSTSDAVLTLAVRDNTVFAGHQAGAIKVWDLDTLTCIRTLRPHLDDIMTLCVLGDDFYSGSANGQMQRWDKEFHLVSTWAAHSALVLSSVTRTRNGRQLITAGSDAVIKIWDVVDDAKPEAYTSVGFQGPMFHALSNFVAFRTIADENHREECRQGALYLKRLLSELGATASILPGATGRNPLVLATFSANAQPVVGAKPRKRVLCYGHYDVVSADDSDQWMNDPFEMCGKNGYIYGRGVSDNKGPMLAIASAASDLRAQQKLDVDLVMIVEGEEEAGSAGFQDAIRKHRALIGDIDVILVSNSYWIGEDIPCLTFGLRGVVHATIRIASTQPDLHSGMQGGVVSEPLVDMVRLLASLTDADGRVRIPGFLDDVRKMTSEESALYTNVIDRCNLSNAEPLEKHSHVDDPRRSLINRWRQPALSIHKIDVAGSSQKTLIPSWASANVSIRIVPDQSLLKIVEQLTSHLNKSFSSLRTRNHLHVDINHVAEWWLGDIHSSYFGAFAACIEDEWGIKPLHIREGGSIPSLPFLESEFSADAVHFPMGMSSDSAHLPDERIRIINLERGKRIVSNWLCTLSSLPSSTML